VKTRGGGGSEPSNGFALPPYESVVNGLELS